MRRYVRTHVRLDPKRNPRIDVGTTYVGTRLKMSVNARLAAKEIDVRKLLRSHVRQYAGHCRAICQDCLSVHVPSLLPNTSQGGDNSKILEVSSVKTRCMSCWGICQVTGDSRTPTCFFACNAARSPIFLFELDRGLFVNKTDLFGSQNGGFSSLPMRFRALLSPSAESTGTVGRMI